MCAFLYDLAVAILGQVAATAIAAAGLLALWRLGGDFVADYRRLCRDACTALTTHAPSIANLSLGDIPAKGVEARDAAEEALRSIADRLANTECPPAWLTRALGLPLPDDVREAGRIIRSLSVSLTLPPGAQPIDKNANEERNRADRAKARSLLGCPNERRGPSN